MSDLSKLTVAKLKALCKEKGLSNYSKLSKPALLEKLGVTALIPNNGAVSSSSSKARDGNAKTAEKGTGREEVKSSADRAAKISTFSIPSSEVGSALPGALHSHREHPADPDKVGRPALFLGTADVPPTAVGMSVFASNGSKRPSDTTFPTSAVPRSKPSKRPKKAHLPPTSSSHKISKIPDIPLRDPDSSLSAHGMSLGTRGQPQPPPSPQASTSSLDNFPESHLSDATPSGSIFPDRIPQIMTIPQSTNRYKPCEGSDVTLQITTTTISPSFQATPQMNNEHPVFPQHNGAEPACLSSFSFMQNQSPLNQTYRQNARTAAPLTPFQLTSTLKSHGIGLSRNVVLSTFIPQEPPTVSPLVLHRPPGPPRTLNFAGPRLKFKKKTDGIFGSTLRQASIRDPVLVSQTMEVTVLQSLKNVTMPPTISQRKRLPTLSLVLSRIDDAERMACVLVSKFVRYAVYLSAQDILKSCFAGDRLSRLICSLASSGFALNMTDLWPYLRLRLREARQAKKAFEEAWLPRFFRGLGDAHLFPISEKLWTSPDHEEQLTVALKFIQTRICFALSPHALDTTLEWVSSAVTDAQQVLENEIWSITCRRAVGGNCVSEETFYVLYQTCEVIGHPPPLRPTSPTGKDCSPVDLSRTESSRIPLRADWSAYIALRLPIATRHLYAPLHEHICGTNADDFERGMARAWLKRMGGRGEEGRLKKQIAEKYILGCVVGNSVSGQYKSTTKMALEFAGVPEVLEHGSRDKHPLPQVNLFVPERHNVESIHFTNLRGQRIHPALAIVQTAGRQEGTFVLMENGFVVGEDEKVTEIWRRLLGCTEDGKSI